MNKFCWLYLKPETFLWTLDVQGIMYNSKTGFGVEFKNVGIIADITKRLLDVKNMYSVKVDYILLRNKELSSFLRKIEELDCGGFTDYTTIESKPIIFPPILHLNIEKKRKLDNKSLKHKIIENLFVLNIFLGGKCFLNCKNCSLYYKQFNYCTKTKSVLNFNSIVEIFNQIDFSFIQNVNFIITEIINYSDWSKLENYLKKRKILITLTFYYKNNNLKNDYLHLNDYNYKIKLLIDFPFDLNLIGYYLLLQEQYQIVFVFVIKSASEYFNVEKIIEEYKIINSEILPFFDGSNFDFFHENLFFTKEDLLNIGLTKRQVFAQGVLNTNNFGILSIFSNGKVYSDFNIAPIGSIYKANIKELIYKEMNSINSWFKIRSIIDPCMNCIFNKLCPPPSYYESVIAQNNLCNIPFKNIELKGTRETAFKLT